MKMRLKQKNSNLNSNHASKAALFVDLANFDESECMATLSSQQLLSSDLVRTSQFDSSSKQINPSLLRGLSKSVSSYQKIDRDEYCTPCDRLARFYTVTASGLTSKQAAKIAKLMSTSQKAPSKVPGSVLSATAPDAFRATQRIAQIAETGKLPQVHKKLPVIALSIGGSSRQRENHRQLRSEPMYGTIKRSHVPAAESPFTRNQSDGTATSRDFSGWNPESTDKEYADSISCCQASTPMMRLKSKAIAIERFSLAVDVVVRSGVLTAGGSGTRAPIPSMNHDALNSIIARVPSISGFLDEQSMQHLLAQELSYVQDEYFDAAARACVEYDIMDPAEASNIGVDRIALYDESVNELWTNMEYQARLNANTLH